MIAITNLHVVAGSFELRDIAFTLEAGEYGVLMGKTGSGKTTILEAISGLKPIVSGSIKLLNREVSQLKPGERGVGYVPQDRALFPNMTVYRHLAFALELRAWDRQSIGRRVQELAELLGIQKLLSRKPLGLSGGESQRVALGRALSYYPKILLLDEPLSALDEETKEEMCQLLKKIQKETQVTTLHVTHGVSEARRLADHIFTLKHGTLHAVAAGDMASLSLGDGDKIQSADQTPSSTRKDHRISATRLPEGGL